MRTLTRIILLCTISLYLSAQKYGNEWINYSQQYYKFPIKTEGVYKIDSTTLSNYFNLNTTNPKNFQVFIKGKEQFIYVKGESDNKVNTGDYIEFYSDKWVGDVDSTLYPNIQYQPNRYFGMFNDTLFAFISLAANASNKHMQLETDTNSAAYPAGNYYYTEQVYAPHNSYNDVAEYPNGAADPVYTQAECQGFRIYIDPAGNFTRLTDSIVNLNAYTGGGLKAYLNYNAAGFLNSSSGAPINHRYRLIIKDPSYNNIVLTDTSFYGYQPIRESFTLDPQTFGNKFKFTFFPTLLTNYPNNENQFTIHYTYFYYPHNLNLAGGNFIKPQLDDDINASKTFYKFSNFNLGNSSSVNFFDITNGRFIKTVLAGGNVRVVVPNGGGRKRCIMFGDSNVIDVKSLKKINQGSNFVNYKNQAGNKSFVIIYNNQLTSSATNYKNYRQSAEGGGYNVIFADVHALFEQFSYGVIQHPLAIRNFIKYLNDSTPVPPKYVLLIGHGVRTAEFSINNPNYVENLVPTMGEPSSDNMLTAAFTGTNYYYPQIPIGRVAALKNTDVENYLAKVKQLEASGDAEWKKNILHFVGGDDDALLARLAAYMDVYKGIIKDTLFGGEVTSFKKNTTSPIQTNISDSAFRTINNGCSILTFFGHGSLTGFDQAIDDPSRYNNTGKYPFLIANSCNSGDIYFPGTRSVSENFLFAHQKGSIGFISTTAFGEDLYLFEYTQNLYRALGATKYGQGLGDAAMEAAFQTSQLGLYERFVSAAMALHGDPSIKLSVGNLPDYQIANNDIRFDLKKYTDSVGVIIHYKNTGTSKTGNISIKTQRYFPNGDSAVVYKLINAPAYHDSIRFYMFTDFNRGIGLNRFSVKIDYFNQVAEKSESNNSTSGTVDLFISGGDIYPVYPFKFAIVPKTSKITLKASTSDPFAPPTNYLLQLDTCDKFANPIQSTSIYSKGGVIEWEVNLPFADSTVYFWRVSRDSTGPQTPYAWRESSFQTIGTKRGWGQAHFNQFKSDKFQFVNYKKDQRKFAFENVQQIITCRDGFWIPGIFDGAGVNYFFNSLRLSEWGCAYNGWNIAVFDSISGQPWEITVPSAPVIGPDSNCMCNPSAKFFSFGLNSNCSGPVLNWKSHLETFLNKVPNNNYILAFTLGYGYNNTYAYPSSYSNSLYNAFESFGAKTIRTVSDTVPMILFGRKGMSAGQGHELVGKSRISNITLNDSIKTRWKSGYIASEKIGPAYQWNSLHWRVKSLDAGAGDSTILKLVGFRPNGKADTITRFRQDSLDIDLSRFIVAADHPYIQLVAYMKDNIYVTSPQLTRWQVIYDEAAECAINPVKGFATINDTLQEGDQVTFRFPIENIGYKSFDDSLAITYWIEDNQRNKILLPDKIRKGPFLPGQLFIDTVKINTFQRAGNNALWIYVNPLKHPKYQKEQYQFNNVGRFPFKVNSDITNPLLDVTFDGVRILNGDIVSSKPNILVVLKDENKFLALNDTGAFTILLQAPGQTLQQRIYFAQGLVFTPASLPKNSCSILYNPNLAVDGKYTLIVQAKDRSANASAHQDYRIQFEVNNKPTVTGVLNYPNPFTTSTRFVFTLTGNEIPEVFTIQIMTITGKVVREITREELGYIHIGRNITEYAWDGRDNFGDRLATGVYLYRVITRLNGSTIEKSASGADKYFTKEYGKMVMMR